MNDNSIDDASSSSLAPFVAAAIRDRVVLEQQEQIKELQATVFDLRHARAPRRIQLVHAPSNRVWLDTTIRSSIGNVHEDDDNEDEEEEEDDLVNLFSPDEGAIDVCMTVRELIESNLVVSVVVNNSTNSNATTASTTTTTTTKILPLADFVWTSLQYYTCGFTQQKVAFWKLTQTSENDNNNHNNGSKVLVQFHGYLAPLDDWEYATHWVGIPVGQWHVPPFMTTDETFFDVEERPVTCPLNNIDTINTANSWPLWNKQVKIAFEDGQFLFSKEFLSQVGARKRR